MPVHDWTRVTAGTFHDFHNAWITELRNALTLASYCAKQPATVYLEPVCVGQSLTDMPLFLTPTHYVNVPLETTYMAAWRGVPARWRRVIETAS